MTPMDTPDETMELSDPSNGERVLIVEDDPSTRSGLAELVQAWGFVTDEAPVALQVLHLCGRRTDRVQQQRHAHIGARQRQRINRRQRVCP